MEVKHLIDYEKNNYGRIRDWLEYHMKSIAIKMIYVILLYSILLTYNLVNRQDGIWNAATYMAGNWELSIGRWALRYVDILRYGITINPLTSVITLILFVLGVEIMLDIFGVNTHSVQNYIGSFLFLSNMVICDVLSYSFTSNGYALAFLLSTIVVSMSMKAKEFRGGWKFIAISSICIGIMMGLYQNYLGCVCLLVLFLIMKFLVNNEFSSIVQIIGNTVISSIIGLCIYELFQKIELARWNVTMNEYLGANDISISFLYNLKCRQQVSQT